MPITSCPTCDSAMDVQHFEDVLFEVCPTCRGIWLDRGEMQKVVAHVRRQEAQAPSLGRGDFAREGRGPSRKPESRDASDDRRISDSRGDRREKQRDYERRRRGFWEMIEDLID